MGSFATPDLADKATYTLVRDIGWTISGSVTAVTPPSFSCANNISITGGYIKLDTAGGGAPRNADCAGAADYGRMVFDATVGSLRICAQTGWIAK